MVGGTTFRRRVIWREIFRVLVLNPLWQKSGAHRTAQEIFVLDRAFALIEGHPADGGCSFRAHDHNQKSYTSEDIDALVAYARPMNAWYVMPVRVVEELKSLMLYPESRGRRSRFERWREAWEVLRKAVRRAPR